jgi:drug/metabolite transporter (DMT)-like permease
MRRCDFGTLGPLDRARLTGIALVIMSAVAFGSGGLFARPVYATGVDWLTLMAWRFAIAGGLSWVVLLANPTARRALRAVSRRMLLATMGLGVWYVSNTATYYAGIAEVDLSLAALIVYIYPPVVAVLALKVGRPLEGRRAWTALGLAVAGVVLAVGGINASTAPPVGSLLLVIAAPLLYSGWIVLAARVSGERSDRTGHGSDAGANAAVAGAVMLTTTAAVYWATCVATAHPVLPAAIPGEAWPGILGVGVVAGFLAVQGFYAGAQRVGAAQASLISTVEPLWTIVAASLLLGERLEPIQWAGGVLILAGVLLSQMPTRDGRPSLAQPAPLLHEE